jgi:hypothetical protein
MAAGHVLAGLAMAVPALSQEPAPLTVGSRVRVKAEAANPHWLVGRLLALPDDSVRLHVADSGAGVALPLATLASFEVSRGRQRQTGRGAWMGAATGALLGLILGAATYEECQSCIGPDPGTGGSAILGAVIMGAFGVGVGALIGGNIRAERWEPVPPPWRP